MTRKDKVQLLNSITPETVDRYGKIQWNFVLNNFNKERSDEGDSISTAKDIKQVFYKYIRPKLGSFNNVPDHIHHVIGRRNNQKK